MANIAAELAAIMAAVYGEEVRGSIHDAIQKINDASEVVLSTGTLIDSSVSSSVGFYLNSLYYNTSTNELWKCVGTNLWESQGILKGEKGENGNQWFRGRQVSATTMASVPLVANVNDNYLNVDEGKIYHCTEGGNVTTWVYDMTLSGGGSGGASDWSELENKPFDTVGTDFKTTGNKLALATAITDKLSELDDKADTVAEIENATEEADKVASAYGVQKFANKYTERISFVIKAEDTEYGIWQDAPSDEWVVDDEHFLIAKELYEADDENVELNFRYDASCGQPIYLGGYQYVGQHTNEDGENVGGLCVKLGNVPDNDVIVYVDITHLHKEVSNYVAEGETLPTTSHRVEIDNGIVTSQASKIECMLDGQRTNVESALNSLNTMIKPKNYGVINGDTVATNMAGWVSQLDGARPSAMGDTKACWFENHFMNETTKYQIIITWEKRYFTRACFGGTWSAWKELSLV